MRSIHVVLVMVAGVGVAAAEQAPRETRPVREADPATMSLEEMRRVRLPADARVQVKTVGPGVVALPVDQKGPDLVALDPTYPGGTVIQTTTGAGAGFPQVDGVGVRFDWTIKNRGDAPGRNNRVKFECSVANTPSDKAHAEFLYGRWCRGFEGVPQVPPLGPGASAQPIRTFVGLPLFGCKWPKAPRPRFVLTVDPLDEVAEPPAGEANNKRTIDLCLD